MHLILPQSQHVLHQQADTCDSCPAAETHEQRFSTGTNQLDNVAVKTDGRHGNYNEELTEFLNRCKEFGRYTCSGCNCCNQGCNDEVDDEEGEYLLEAE